MEGKISGNQAKAKNDGENNNDWKSSKNHQSLLELAKTTNSINKYFAYPGSIFVASYMSQSKASILFTSCIGSKINNKQNIRNSTISDH